MKRFFWMLACFALSSAFAWSAKVALLIGCNGYEGAAFPQLNACMADVQRMQGVLQKAGFEVYALTDEAMGSDGKRHMDLYYPDKPNIEKELRVVAAEKSLGKMRVSFIRINAISKSNCKS